MQIIQSSPFFRSWLFLLLSCLLSQNTIAVEQTPVTTTGLSILNVCLPPERAFTKAPASLLGASHCRIENILIKAWREAYLAHETNHTYIKLLNSGIAGMELNRGPHLLSFAASNGFRRLAYWALINGADINRSNLDGGTMLFTAIADGQPYMVDFILQQKADVNRVFRVDDRQINALSAMVKHSWEMPLPTLSRMVSEGAVPLTAKETYMITSYIHRIARQSEMKDAKRLINDLRFSENLVSPKLAQSADRIPVSMRDTMDRYIRFYMENGFITPEDMNAFEVHGKRFEHFLAYNGFAKSLEYRLQFTLMEKEARKRIHNRDTRGNDLLLAAIHSQNTATIEAVLKVSNEAINQRIPTVSGFHNKGSRPLGTARQLKSSQHLIDLLIRRGADPLPYSL